MAREMSGPAASLAREAATPEGAYVPTADERIFLHDVPAGRYQTAERSTVLPGLDLPLLTTFLDPASVPQAPVEGA
jgi:hypothetical protein